MELTQREKKKNKVFFLIFAIFWTALVVWNFLTPVRGFSEEENRALAGFPTFTVQGLLDGDYMDGVNSFFNDQFAARSWWVGAQSLMEYAIGKREVNSVYLGKGALFAHLPQEDAAITADNIAGINAFAQKYDIPSTVLLVPSSTAVQTDKLPNFATAWDEASFIQRVNAKFAAEVTPLEVYPTLQEHSAEYIYYRTDHHWTSYGAYLAYQQLAQSMGFSAVALEKIEQQELSSAFLGTYHSKTGFPLVQADTMQLLQNGRATQFAVFDGAKTTTHPGMYFEEFLAKKDKYSYFLGQVQPYVTIRTAAQTDKKLIVFKDSYAHCLVPMLLDAYSEIRLVDLRYLNMKDVADYVNISQYDEALFLYSADVFAHQEGTSKLLR